MQAGVHGNGLGPDGVILRARAAPDVQPQAVLGVDVDEKVCLAGGRLRLDGGGVIGGGFHQADPAGYPVVAGVAPGVAGGGGLRPGDGQPGVHGNRGGADSGIFGAGSRPQVQAKTILGVDVDGIAGLGGGGQKGRQQDQTHQQSAQTAGQAIALHGDQSSLFVSRGLASSYRRGRGKVNKKRGPVRRSNWPGNGQILWFVIQYYRLYFIVRDSAHLAGADDNGDASLAKRNYGCVL